MNSIVLELEGLNCASCADKIEKIANNAEDVNEANFNFITKKLEIKLNNEDNRDELIEELTSIIGELEPDVIVLDKSPNINLSDNINLVLEGLDCASCADKINQSVKKMDEVIKAELNFVTKKLVVKVSDSKYINKVKKQIEFIVYKLEPNVNIIDLDKNKEESEEIILLLEGLDCGSCADKIKSKASKIPGIKYLELDFISKKMKLNIKNKEKKNLILAEIENITHTLEPDVEIIDVSRGEIKNDIADTNEENKELKKETKELIKIGISAMFFIMPFMLKLEGNLRFISYFISYLIVGLDVIKIAFKNFIAGNALDEHFLMTIATIAAFITGEYPEGVMVMLLYKLGEYFQGRAVNHSRRSIKSAMDIRPEFANLVVGESSVKVNPEDVNIGDQILVLPGERVPLDGIVIEGESSLDTSNITGESVPRSIKTGDEIVSGVVNNTGLLKVKVNKGFGESTINKILDLVENASSRKAPTENFITRFSRIYTPIVVLIAVIIALVPSIITGNWNIWLYRAAVFLVISCPCALVISVPLGFFGGIGAASKQGILVKGGNYLEALADVDTLVFDKTGTITKGTFTVTNIETYSNYTEDEILKIGAYGEAYSNHPIGKSITEFYEKTIDKSKIEDYREIPGKGISVKIDGKNILLGNESLFTENNIEVRKQKSIGTLVYIAEAKEHIGTIVVSDELKPEIREILEELEDKGIKRSVMLSGDNQETVDEVAKLAGINEAYGDLMPQDKVEIFESIIKENKKDKKVAFIGDGVNDAPVLARADLGIAMGGLGSDAAIEAADIVIMNDEINKISTGIDISRKTKRIVSQNILIALGIKLMVLVLGAFGKASMWQAVFADVGVSIIAIFNSMRALIVNKNE